MILHSFAHAVEITPLKHFLRQTVSHPFLSLNSFSFWLSFMVLLRIILAPVKDDKKNLSTPSIFYIDFFLSFRLLGPLEKTNAPLAKASSG